MSHVFLTGPKRVGKSTLIGKVLMLYSGHLGGFRTVRTREFLGNRWSVHLLPGDGSQGPGRENLLFLCGEPGLDGTGRFDALGPQALLLPGELVLMDELGPHEEEAQAFRRAVWDTLDGNKPVLGVLQHPFSPFLESIARREDVTLLKITPDNRDDPQLPGQIFSLLFP